MLDLLHHAINLLRDSVWDGIAVALAILIPVLGLLTRVISSSRTSDLTRARSVWSRRSAIRRREIRGLTSRVAARLPHKGSGARPGPSLAFAVYLQNELS